MKRSIRFTATAMMALTPGWAQAQSTEARRAELLRQREAIDAELSRLEVPAPSTLPQAAQTSPASTLSAPQDIVVTGKALTLTTKVVGQTDTTIKAEVLRNTPASTIADIVKLSPGVTVLGGNGPRDVSVSIRGSNARNVFGARNIQVFEDDFPVTQPDGLARFDLTDPHAYGAVDVVRGPSSALYGNYAIEGAINFRTRRGRDIDGIEAGLDGGSYGYLNAYATLGHGDQSYDYSLFGSFVRGNGATGHSGSETGTINAMATVHLSDRDRLTGKVIYNENEIRLPIRLSYDQFKANPYQQGCERAATAAPGCATISVLVNGINGPRIPQTAAEGDLARNDRRTIVGARWEHDFSSNTTWRTQALFDSRVINQPTQAFPFKGTLNSYAISSDLTDRRQILGMDAVNFLGVSYNYLDNQSFAFNKTPDGRDGFGAAVQTVFGDVRNLAVRAREELSLTPTLRVVAGVGAEWSIINARQTFFLYPPDMTPIPLPVTARRHFTNVAPEASLVWQAAPSLRLHARIGTAYGIPQSLDLFVTPDGLPGDNTGLKAQKITGTDVGATLELGRTLTAELTGYYEWFRNEQVTQSAGLNFSSFTTNAPRSIHRGVEAAFEWRPAAITGGFVRANYSYNDQRYTRYAEPLFNVTESRLIDHAGNRIPGVIPSFGNVRVGYDQAAGLLTGLGGFVEVTRRSGYWVDNANLLYIPGVTLVNLNVHYDPPESSALSRLSFFAAVDNLTDEVYVGTSSIIADSLTPKFMPSSSWVLRTVTGSFYAGQPRTVYVGIKARF